MANIGTYFEIPVTDMNRAIDFYSFVFGCEFAKDTIHDCEMAFFPYTEGAGITGALAKGKIYKPSIEGSLIYLSTTNIDLILKKLLKKVVHSSFQKLKYQILAIQRSLRTVKGIGLLCFKLILR